MTIFWAEGFLTFATGEKPPRGGRAFFKPGKFKPPSKVAFLADDNSTYMSMEIAEGVLLLWIKREDGRVFVDRIRGPGVDEIVAEVLKRRPA